MKFSSASSSQAQGFSCDACYLLPGTLAKLIWGLESVIFLPYFLVIAEMRIQPPTWHSINTITWL